MSNRHDGRIALILGAAARDNMGQAIARRLLADGARVIVAGRHEDELARFAGETGCEYGLADITSEDDLATLCGGIAERHGGIDIAVNATGWGLLTPFLEMRREDLEKITQLQFVGAILFYQAVLRIMRKGGSLLQISSATATLMMQDHAAYMGTKAGADHVIRTIADEFGAQDIRANIIAPGFTDTPMTEQATALPGMIEAFEKEYPLGRINTKADVANAISWVASDECFMTGQTFQVNGGLTLRRNPRNAEIAASVRAARAKD